TRPGPCGGHAAGDALEGLPAQGRKPAASRTTREGVLGAAPAEDPRHAGLGYAHGNRRYRRLAHAAGPGWSTLPQHVGVPRCVAGEHRRPHKSCVARWLLAIAVSRRKTLKFVVCP